MMVSGWCEIHSSSDALNTVCDFLSVKNLFPVIAHEARFAEGDGFVAGIRELAGYLLEDDR